MMSLAQSVPGIFAPTLAVALLAVTDVKVILLADALSYALAILTVFCVAMPSTPRKSASDRQGLWQDSLFGFRYILRRPGLLGLESVVFGIMLIGLMGWTLLTPMIMARTGNSASQVGIVQSLGAVGGVAGGILIGVLKPTPHKIGRILTAILVFSLLGRLLIGLGDSIAVWSIGWCCAWSCLPFILGYSQAIWQEKVAPEAQGRVFAARNLVESVATPIALGIAGPLADHVFEPGMRPGGGSPTGSDGSSEPGRARECRSSSCSPAFSAQAWPPWASRCRRCATSKRCSRITMRPSRRTPSAPVVSEPSYGWRHKCNPNTRSS